MNSLHISEILLIFLWTLAAFVPGMHCSSVTVLTKEDVLLLKDEPNPKCFARTENDFTCFLETSDNKTYDLFYSRSSRPKTRCKVSVQRSEEGTNLHICSFLGLDVFLYTEMLVEVVERSSNTKLYSRTLSVEDHFLLEPPFNVSLHPIDKVGQLKVLWNQKVSKYREKDLTHRIRYSSRGRGDQITEAKSTGHILASLEPGEEVEVWVSNKCPPYSGHWSSWSKPGKAFVPQSAGDFPLLCSTSDLQNVTCHWNRTKYGVKNQYGLFYKTGFSEPLSWTEWTQCDGNLADFCSFRGDQFRNMKVKLSRSPASTGRIFYSGEFALNNSIKTSMPAHLRGAVRKGSLCLRWEAPLASLRPHLEYEVDYQVRGREKVKNVISLRGSEPESCVNVPASSYYSVKVRAKPTGPVYSGDWSDWSHSLTGNTPSDTGVWIMVGIPVSLMVAAIILIPLFSKYFRKLKLYFWPPVPNLDKVLHGFLTEINKQSWDLPVGAKQICEEAASSVVEVISEEQKPESGKPSEESVALLPAESSSSSELERPTPGCGTEVFPDYVTLNKDSVVVCPRGNSYVCEQPAEEEEKKKPTGEECSSSSSSSPAPHFLNNAYLPLAESAFTRKVSTSNGSKPSDRYANLPYRNSQ